MLGRFVPALVWESKPVRSVRRPFASAVGVWRIWAKRRRDIVEARAECDRLLHDHSRLLVEGDWKLHIVRRKAPGKPFRRLQKQIQAVLVREGAVSLSDALRACGLDPARHDVWLGGRSSLVDVDLEAPDDGFRPAVVLPRHSRKDLFFDLESRRVLRISPEGFTDEYERLRRRFSAHVPSVAFEVLPGRHGIVEPFVEGRPLSQVDVDVMVRSVAHLLGGLSELAVEFGDGDSAEHVAVTIDASDPTLGAHRVRGAIVEWLGAAPQVPAHGDLHAANVLVTAEGPVCIDFGYTSIQPSWFDGLRLAMESVRRLESRDGGQTGALDEALREFLLRTIPAPLPDDWRRLAALGFSADESIGRKIPNRAWFDRRD